MREDDRQTAGLSGARSRDMHDAAVKVHADVLVAVQSIRFCFPAVFTSPLINELSHDSGRDAIGPVGAWRRYRENRPGKPAGKVVSYVLRGIDPEWFHMFPRVNQRTTAPAPMYRPFWSARVRISMTFALASRDVRCRGAAADLGRSACHHPVA